MFLKSKIEHLKSLSLEEMIYKDTKMISCLTCVIIALPGLSLGVYYWFFNEVLFSYQNISPFCGFLIIIGITIAILTIIALIVESYYKEYNAIVKKAHSNILTLINDESNLKNEEIYKLKVLYIENLIGSRSLSTKDFIWHSQRYCWGCGNKHIYTPLIYRVDVSKTESWKVAPIRYTQTFYKSSRILLCPDCYSKANIKNKIENKNSRIVLRIFLCISIVLSLGCLVYFLIHYISSGYMSMFKCILFSFLNSLICFSIVFSVFRFLFVMLSFFISLPFQTKTDVSFPKWDFNNIPELLKFLNTTQHKKQ